MFISLHDLKLHNIDFKEELRPDAMDCGPDVQQILPLRSSGRAELIEEHHGRKGTVDDIRLVGELSTSLELICARCLDPVKHDVQRDFDLLYRPQGTDAGVEEIPVNRSEAEIGYYTGDGLLLEDVLREQVLLAVPFKVLCHEDCRGLCPHCGKNLNQDQCSCTEPIEDPRWSGLKELRDKLES